MVTTPSAPRSPDDGPIRGSARRDPLSALGAFIQQKGLKRSRQRDLVAQAFFAMGGHVPVEAVMARAREQDPHVSVATVYRTMKLLAECGLAIARQFGDGQTRYEPSTRRHADAHDHDHLICTGCGQIIEFESERISELQRRVARRHGFEVERRRVELYGRCAACRRAAPTQESA